MKRTILITFLLIFLMFSCEDKPTLPENKCSNGILDPGENGIDCGNSCPDCFDVKIDHELAIRHLKVVNSTEAKSGPFSFGKLMFNLGEQDSMKTKLLIQSLFSSWDRDQIVNGFTVPARPQMNGMFLGEWMERDGATSIDDWTINFANAPLRLLTITNRVDLSNTDSFSAGEGRLTFGQDDNGNNDFTLILEYNLNIPAKDSSHVNKWANRWHQLSGMDKESSQYKDTLISIVETFTRDDIKLNALRTNSILGVGPWEFREFNIENGRFVEKPRKNNPDVSLNGTLELANYLSQSEISKELANSTHSVRDSMLAGNTQYGSSFTWNAPNISTEHLELLDFISCTGCHGGFRSSTGFTHIKPRSEGEQSIFSDFMEDRLDIRQESLNILLKLPSIVSIASESEMQQLDSITLAEKIRLRRFMNVQTSH